MDSKLIKEQCKASRFFVEFWRILAKQYVSLQGRFRVSEN